MADWNENPYNDGSFQSGSNTGGEIIWPDPSPTAKQTSSRTAQTFQAQINPWSSALATCDEPLNAWTLPVSSASGCPTVKVADREYLQPIYINACADSYGLQIDGGLTQNDQNNLWQQENKPGHKLVMGIVRQLRDHLPWISKLYAGRGIKFTDYGLFPIPDPDNPGTSIAAPGAKDKRVQGKLIEARSSGDATGRPRFVPGVAIDFTICPAPLDPPAVTTSVGTGPNGDNEDRQYALVYKVSSAHGELGPGSDWIAGYLQADLVIPIVPAGAGWVAVTGQALYRTKGDDSGIFYLHTTYADLLTHSFTDTTPDSSLGAAYVKTVTAINVERSYTDVLHSPDVSNDSDLGLGGVTGNGLKVGNHDRVDYLPDPATAKMLPCAAPRVAPSVSVSTGAGPGAGDRQYAILYHTAAGDSVKGPASRWIEGTLATGVALAAVPTLPTGVWTDVTGQALLRTKAGGGPFYVVHDYPGSLTLQGFIDSVPDSSLVTGYSEQAVTVKSLGGGDVQLNDVDVATEPTLDFEDSATVTWTLTDDPTNTRVKVSAAASGGGGGGGGGGAGTGAATYYVNTVSGAHQTLGADINIPWDTLLEGDDLYLDVSNPAALTIPADGDYFVSTAIDGFIDSTPPTAGYLYGYHMWIYHKRGGTVLTGGGGPDTGYEVFQQYWTGTEENTNGLADGYIHAFNAVAVPACLAGDTIVVTINAFSSGGPSQWHAGYGNGFPGVETWVSIAPVGKTTAVSVPSNAAIYNIASDFGAIASGSTTHYIPWDTILMGADLYLDVGHTDGLTIPADGAGDYTVNTLLRFNTQGFAGTQWSVQWFLTIEVWRSGSQILFLLQDDIYQHPLDHDGFPILDENDELPFQMSAVLPALLVGDVVKIGWQYYNGGSLAGGPHTPDPGAQVIESGPYTYISIGRIGVTP